MSNSSIRISSTALIHAPGVARWIANMFRTDAVGAIFAATSLAAEAPAWSVWGLVLGAYAIDGDSIILDRAHAESAAEAYADVRRAQAIHEDAIADNSMPGCTSDDVIAWTAESRDALTKARDRLTALTKILVLADGGSN